MKIKSIVKFLIVFYATLVVLVSYGIYTVHTQNLIIDELREQRLSIVDRIAKHSCTQEEQMILKHNREKVEFVRENTHYSLILIYFIMFIALVSFVFAYRVFSKRIFIPIEKMNKIILEYQAGNNDIKEIESNDDEIGLMIKEFFIMKKMHDEDYAEIEKLSVSDSLTGVLNRRAFVELGESITKLSLRNKTTFSIMLLDIDYFKKVNDNYGHLIGDDVLKHFVKIVASEMRDSDIFARFGGEEFVAVLPDTQEDGALVLAEKIRQSVEESPFKNSEFEIALSVSIGVATLKDETLLADILHRADQAVYDAKANGRNRVEVA